MVASAMSTFQAVRVFEVFRVLQPSKCVAYSWQSMLLSVGIPRYPAMECLCLLSWGAAGTGICMAHVIQILEFGLQV